MQRLYDVILTDAIRRDPGYDSMVPGLPYCMTMLGLERAMQREAARGERHVASWCPSDIPTLWNGESLDGARVAFHQSGSLGDELVHSAFTYQLYNDHPRFRFTNYTHGYNRLMAFGNKICGMRATGIGHAWPAEIVRSYDYWILPSPVSHFTRGSDVNIYDAFEAEYGITVDVKQPYVHTTGMDWQELLALLKPAELPPSFWERLIVIQLHASDAVRTPDEWGERLQVIVRELSLRLSGDWWFVLAGEGMRVFQAINDAGIAKRYRVLPVALMPDGTSLSARSLMQMISRARLVICPDSFGLHAAAAFDVPTLALWNLGNGGAEPVVVDEMDELRMGVRAVLGLPLEDARTLAPPPVSRLSTYPSAQAIDMADDPSVTVERAMEILA